jgi:single-strand DNA-binding protein
MSKGTVNKFIVLGNLGDDPEIRYTANKGTAVARISVATSERYKGEDGEYKTRTEWHRIILWAGLAELAKKFLTKGSKVYVEGRLQNRSWDDKESGQKRYATDLVGDSLEMLGSPRTAEDKERSAYDVAYGESKGIPLAVDAVDPDDAAQIPF